MVPKQIKYDTQGQVHGDIRSFMAYVPDSDGDKEPALVLAPVYHRFHGRNCYVIPLSCAAFYWPDTDKQKKAYVKRLLLVAELLGFAGDPMSQWRVARRLASIIEDRLQDLLEMAEYEVVKHDRAGPEPKEIGEVNIRINGQNFYQPVLEEGADVVEPL